jgi:hypothetical protein
MMGLQKPVEGMKILVHGGSSPPFGTEVRLRPLLIAS